MRNIDINVSKNLTQDEKDLFAILTKVAREKAPTTSPRVAGGWVRDKLLGVPSDDIDVMTDQLSGETFAALVAQELNLKGPAVFKLNPEKSKHLETSEMTIPVPSGTEFKVQFAGARKEIYNEDSRNPVISKASPQEDSERRDLTINSLFYNLITQKVEDFTGKGIKDLITNTIRTPLDPLKTFSDDPLRIFRTIRFAAKYGGKIDKDTYSALMNPELKSILRNKEKLSRERIGMEIAKMFKNPNSQIAIQILKDTGLWNDIIEESLKGTKYEGKMAPLDMEQNNPNHKLSLWGHTFQVLSNLLEKFPQYEGEKKIVMVLAALSHDLGKLYADIQTQRPPTDKYPGHEKGYTSYIGHEDESSEIIQHILRYLKLEPLIQQVSGLAKYHMMPHSLVRDESSEKALRKFIRRMGELSLNWIDVLNISIADAYSKDKSIDPETVKEYYDLEQRLQAAMASLSMAPDSAKIPPVLDGREIMSILNMKPGPQMKEITEFVKELKDENPNITKEEATQKLKEKYIPNVQQSPTVQAAKEAQAASDDETEDKKIKFSICSKQMLDQKIKDIRDLIKDGKVYEITSILEDLKGKYGDDEKISRVIAMNTFNTLLMDSKSRNNNLLQYVFDKAKENFFDAVLNAYAYGILLITKTSTEDKILKEVSSRVLKISPGILKTVLDSIPKEKILNMKSYQDTRDFLKNENTQN